MMINKYTEKNANNVKAKFRDGSIIEYQLPSPSLVLSKSIFAFSLHKAGSTLLNNLLDEYLQSIGILTVDYSRFSVQNGQDAIFLDPTSQNDLLKAEGYCYTGWRTYAPILDGFDFKNIKSVLLVRDPRDRLVSQFFSFGRSHALPEHGASLDIFNASRETANRLSIQEYALNQAEWITTNWHDYHAHLNPLTTRVYRYEDVIFRKHEWLVDMVNYFCIPLDMNIIEKVVSTNNVIPKHENQDLHIRQVYPGNYVNYLDDDTLETLNVLFGYFLEKYSYSNQDGYGLNLVYANEGSDTARLFS